MRHCVRGSGGTEDISLLSLFFGRSMAHPHIHSIHSRSDMAGDAAIRKENGSLTFMVKEILEYLTSFGLHTDLRSGGACSLQLMITEIKVTSRRKSYYLRVHLQRSTQGMVVIACLI